MEINLELTINSIYDDLLYNRDRYLVLFGGADSGKSYFIGAQLLLYRHLTEAGHKTMVVRKVASTLRDSVFTEILDAISDNNLDEHFKINRTNMTITNILNGNEFIFKGLDKVKKLKSIKGITDIWIEEADEITYQDFLQLSLRMRGEPSEYNQMILTFNPVSADSWTKLQFYDVAKETLLKTDDHKPKKWRFKTSENIDGESIEYFTTVLKTTYKDNKFITGERKLAIEKLKDVDYYYYTVYALGEYGVLGNLIYTNWRVEDLSSIKDSFDNNRNGVDWGFSIDPFAFVRMHIDKMRKKIFIYKEIYKTNLDNETSAIQVKDIVKNESVICDNAEPKSISDFKKYGVYATAAKKGKGSIEHGIKFIQHFEIIIDNNCTGSIKDFSRYKWKEDKDGNVLRIPVDKDNHICDACRYALENDMGEMDAILFA